MPDFRFLSVAALWALTLACSGEQPTGASAAEASRLEAQPPRPKQPATPPQLPRSSDLRVAGLCEALERSDLGKARQLAAALGGSDDLDARLALARLLFAEGDQVGAVRTLEELRAEHPLQGRVFATAAELEAWAGRGKSAEDAVREGLASCGPSPDLLRARGVLALCRNGGAQLALEHLLAARQEDPGLPYVLRPLAQAHVLLGSQAMAANPPDAISALAHATAALKALPAEADAVRLLADGHSALGELEEALRLYEQLIAEGDGSARHACAQLLPRAATAALLAGEREKALRHYMRARELGLPDEDLGFGAQMLADEVGGLLDSGIERAEAGDFGGARELFERALVHDSRSLEARTLLGAILFKQGDFEAAAGAWGAVLASAREQKLELPTPVHLDLARALRLAGRVEEARTLLRAELERDPEGRWAEDARRLLAYLPESEQGR